MSETTQNTPLTWPCNLLLRRFYIPIKPAMQRDDISCGISCLKMILDYHGCHASSDETVGLLKPDPCIGLYDSQLGMAALSLGYSVSIFTYNYRIFHPIWNHLDRLELLENLNIQSRNLTDSRRVGDARRLKAIRSYIRFIESGGNLFFYPLSKEMILAHFDNHLPVIASLDLSFLYDCMAFEDEFDEYRATHFVALHGYDPERHTFEITDPWHSIPIPNENGHYHLDADRVINAVFLGECVHDSSIIIIEPEKVKPRISKTTTSTAKSPPPTSSPD